ncbi:MIP III precursor [Biomphalaria pfeifferi]|uniref:MIP III n=1 Tax=Biomphalaria pfeifferi TaxID=112525 RepID=A0AAD8B9N1_BIOPF|nr:MIP III precursor [Biomphalaria pfeifferi]
MVYGFLTTVLLVLVFNDSGTQGIPTKVCTSSSRSSSNGICGGALYDAIHAVCDIYYPRNRRDVMSDSVDPLADITVSKPNALSYLTKREHSVSNVVCECCLNQCSLSEMLDYCPTIRGK